MIQKTNARYASTAIAPLRQAVTDGPEHWGKWSGRKHYSLEVVQHPLRARMCGFGDKDRRPLAPAAVAKMIVTGEDNSLINVDDVDCSFFLVTADLWSEDGKQEMNLVLHPSSSDRYVPSHSAKTRRRGSSTTAPLQRATYQGSVASHHAQSLSQNSTRAVGDSQTNGMAPMMPATTTYANQTYPFSQQPHPMPELTNFQASSSYGSPSESPPTWGYTPQAPPADRNPSFAPTVLPSIHSFGRNTSPANGLGTVATEDSWHTDTSVRETQDVASFRSWPTETSYPGIDSTTAQSVFSGSAVDPSLRGPPHSHPSSHPDPREGSWSQSPLPSVAADLHAHHGRYNQETFSAPVLNSQYDNNMYATASYSQQPPQTSPYYQGSHAQNPSHPGSNIPPLPRHTYTRTLVGPLSANACRLLDEHRKPGIFFLFQDLSVRTEGTFRLRLRLINVGCPPAPEPGALGVHTGMSPVLAQAFSEPFIVYSAKRFPGVPDTTALSIALGNQGQKLPLRNRHGSGKQGRRRRREGDSDGSDDEGSDGG